MVVAAPVACQHDLNMRVPAGTTIAGVYELEKAGLRQAFITAVCAATNRADEFAKL